MTSQLRYGILTSPMTDVLQIPINMCRTRAERVGGAAHVTSGEKFPIKSRCRDLERHGGGKRPVGEQLSSGNERRRQIRLERERKSLFWDTRSVSDDLYSRYRQAAESESQLAGVRDLDQLLYNGSSETYPTLINQPNCLYRLRKYAWNINLLAVLLQEFVRHKGIPVYFLFVSRQVNIVKRAL